MDKAQVIALAGKAGFGGNQRNTLLVKLMAFAKEVEQAEREACAVTCETISKDIVCPEECAEAIRMRPNMK